MEVSQSVSAPGADRATSGAMHHLVKGRAFALPDAFDIAVAK
jgi:hypothetical protein